MAKRFVSIWFRYLKTDWFQLRRPALKESPFVLARTEHGRKLVAAADPKAEAQGIYSGATAADARAIIPDLEVIDDIPGLEEKLLTALANWAIRFTPVAAVDGADGLVLDSTGCAHLWGGEADYLQAIGSRLRQAGYEVRIAMADTIGAAWGLARFGRGSGLAVGDGKPGQVGADTSAKPRVDGFIQAKPGTDGFIQAKPRVDGLIQAKPGTDGFTQAKPRATIMLVEGQGQMEAVLGLPAAALRLESPTLGRLGKLGFVTIGHFAHLARTALRRRFGTQLLLRLDQAFGRERESLEPVRPVAVYEERLPCPEPIATAGGIGIAMERLLDTMARRLQREGKGLREAVFKSFCIDGRVSQVQIATNRASHHVAHLFKLFEPKIQEIEPGLGIELFLLEAPKVEELSPIQEQFWAGDHGPSDRRIAELMDQFTDRFGASCVARFLPDEHHWPERSVKLAQTTDEQATIPWRTDRPRPAHLLSRPEPIEVAAPVPDYPPMLFRYRGKVHRIKKADGPERIEREWWIQEGPHRDYYCVEDEEGARYWVFRSGHYSGDSTQRWFIHGFFA